MTAYLRRSAMPEASPARWTGRCAPSGCQGSGATRASGPRSRPRTGTGPVTCSTATSPPPRRTGPGSPTSPTCRTWAGFVYVAFIVDVFAQRIVAWHAATTKHTDLVMIPLRMALWQRDREGNPTTARRADPPLRCRVAIHESCGSPSTSRSRRSGPRSARSATPTTTP